MYLPVVALSNVLFNVPNIFTVSFTINWELFTFTDIDELSKSIVSLYCNAVLFP